MPFRRTDEGKIIWPQGISSEDRRFCRDIYASLINHDIGRLPGTYAQAGLKHGSNIIIGCSGGLDSTVLAHAYVQRTILRPRLNDALISTTLMYVDHNLRSKDEIELDIQHVNYLANSLGVQSSIVKVKVQDGNVQAQAREARYDAMVRVAGQLDSASVYLAHHVNDVAETKLWQFLTGRQVIGINRTLVRNNIIFSRPLLDFTRDDLLRYAGIWSLNWHEDYTNSTDKYARNRIRHELIPWIEKELNPGVVKMLGKPGM
jgi:tRNA(Ile)-lysidine synthase